jgi:hypothetical protein
MNFLVNINLVVVDLIYGFCTSGSYMGYASNGSWFFSVQPCTQAGC